MIKTFPGGTGPVGYVKDSLFENFWAYDTTYGLGKSLFYLDSKNLQLTLHKISTNTGNHTPPPTLEPSLSAASHSTTGPVRWTTAFLAGQSSSAVPTLCP